jgi:hypothetical protein
MSSPTPSTPTLSHGSDLEYRAFSRRFFPNQEAGVLLLTATCFYGSPGFSISFQKTASGFNLVETVPTGIEPQLVTYYSASWSSSQQEGITKHVTITDAAGSHRVPVKEW